MEATLQTTQPISGRSAIWIGRALSALAVVFLLFDSAVKLSHNIHAVTATSRLGYAPSVLTPLAIVELACVALYAVPSTTLVGATLLTAWLGGATASHVRIGDPIWFPVAFGVIVWLGVYLRHPALRRLVVR